MKPEKGVNLISIVVKGSFTAKYYQGNLESEPAEHEL